jgi:hypothetical protein
MWRWVTRGLVLTFATALLTPALLAQESIGSIDEPDPGVTQTGLIKVRGYLLDQQQASRMELYVDDQFQHRVNTGLPRIDIQQAYPNWPGIFNMAPGFQTGFLASRFTNGNHTISVRAFMSDNRVVEIGRRTITIDNSLNQAPIGNVDIPDLGAIYNASGSFPVVGWATDTDGVARIDVYIDGAIMQNAIYGDERPDVGNTFADFPAALFSGWVAHIDTTRIQNGVHLMEIRAVDRLGASRLIGRRQVQIFNNETNLKPFGYLDEPKRDAVLYGTRCNVVPPQVFSPSFPINTNSHITPVRGWALDLGTRLNEGRVSYVELMIDGVRWLSTDNCAFSTMFNTYTNCYGMPRYDVARYFPTYPDSVHSGFVFTLDVGALLAVGVPPGHHVMKVRVGDQQQTFAELPGPAGIPVNFQCAEDRVASAQGFIDIPTAFDFLKGTVVFQGWALAESIPGIAAIEIVVDGDFIGQAQYGFPRPDVQSAYPFVPNATNSGWRFQVDTTKFSNARHRLTVRAVDTRGLKTEIGSVDFYVQNLGPN